MSRGFGVVLVLLPTKGGFFQDRSPAYSAEPERRRSSSSGILYERALSIIRMEGEAYQCSSLGGFVVYSDASVNELRCVLMPEKEGGRLYVHTTEELRKELPYHECSLDASLR